MGYWDDIKVRAFVRIGDAEPRPYESFTEEEKLDIAQKLNEQAARQIVLSPDMFIEKGTE